MKLPYGERAVVDIQKLSDYCLDPHHPHGRNKARVFASALGLLRHHAEFLCHELLRAAATIEAAAGETDEYGARYTIDFEISRQERQAMIRSAWIVLQDETFPRLTTCYVLSK